MDFSTLKNLFKTMATLHVDIAHSDSNMHFSAIDIWEAEEATRSTINFPACILECPEFRLQAVTADNPFNHKSTAFWIIDACERGNFDQESQVLDFAETVGLEFISYINQNRDQLKIFDFTINSVRAQKVGPIWDNCYGYRFTLEFGDPEPRVIFNPLKWLS